MQESPLFSKIKAEGKTSKNPIKESFGKKENLKLVLLALFGAAMGQGVVWYTGQFYALSFLQNTCKVEYVQSNYIIATALVIGTPMFILFGWLSDRVGRKYIMMIGMLLAVILYRPMYKVIFSTADVRQKVELAGSRSITRSTTFDAGDTTRSVKTFYAFTDGTTVTESERTLTKADRTKPAVEKKTDVVLNTGAFWLVVSLIVIQVIMVTMVYGPIAAFLVELFPTRIRYTSMSLPYHIGNGVFGGLTPLIATALVTPDDPVRGLWYPIGVAAVCFVIGMIFLSNKIPAGSDND
jgi:MHS family proline/betaine transporter-like MFS transporter